ncbi:MAG: GAF domain-containing protein [Opitutales bacterium]|nr:GAF domain-containing protein [Opitutales bacterium]
MISTDYALLHRQSAALFEGIRDQTANAANLAAIIYHGVEGLNWAGFYWWKDGGLILGPFQGRPACVRIAAGRGVCGAALHGRRTLRVPDVQAFPGHIACDPKSRSEMVIPLFVGERPLGVFDLDSPRPGRFSPEDQTGLEAIAALFLANIDPESG